MAIKAATLPDMGGGGGNDDTLRWITLLNTMQNRQEMQAYRQQESARRDSRWERAFSYRQGQDATRNERADRYLGLALSKEERAEVNQVMRNERHLRQIRNMDAVMKSRELSDKLKGTGMEIRQGMYRLAQNEADRRELDSIYKRMGDMYDFEQDLTPENLKRLRSATEIQDRILAGGMPVGEGEDLNNWQKRQTEQAAGDEGKIAAIKALRSDEEELAKILGEWDASENNTRLEMKNLAAGRESVDRVDAKADRTLRNYLGARRENRAAMKFKWMATDREREAARQVLTDQRAADRHLMALDRNTRDMITHGISLAQENRRAMKFEHWQDRSKAELAGYQAKMLMAEGRYKMAEDANERAFRREQRKEQLAAVNSLGNRLDAALRGRYSSEQTKALLLSQDFRDAAQLAGLKIRHDLAPSMMAARMYLGELSTSAENLELLNSLNADAEGKADRVLELWMSAMREPGVADATLGAPERKYPDMRHLLPLGITGPNVTSGDKGARMQKLTGLLMRYAGAHAGMPSAEIMDNFAKFLTWSKEGGMNIPDVIEEFGRRGEEGFLAYLEQEKQKKMDAAAANTAAELAKRVAPEQQAVMQGYFPSLF